MSIDGSESTRRASDRTGEWVIYKMTETTDERRKTPIVKYTPIAIIERVPMGETPPIDRVVPDNGGVYATKRIMQSRLPRALWEEIERSGDRLRHIAWEGIEGEQIH